MVDRLEVLCDRRRSRAPGEMLMRQRSRFASPFALFADGSVGAWYDPSDHTTLFQDSAGTTPANAPGDPVGLVLDKSQGLVLGPELVTNGTFDTDVSGWVDDTSHWSVSSEMAYHSPSDVFNTLRQSMGFVSGNVYQVSFDYEVTQGTLRVQDRTEANSANGLFHISLTGSGRRTFVFVANATIDSIAFARDISGQVSEFSIDNISVRELPGHHAFQDTNDDFRPTLARHPASGLRNLFTIPTEDFADVGWLTQGGAWGAIDSKGFQEFTEDTATGQHRLFEDGLPMTSGSDYTLSATVEYVDRQWVFLALFDGVTTIRAWFDLLNGVKGSVDAGATSAMVADGEGYAISITRTAASTTSSANAQLSASIGDNASANYAGAGLKFKAAKYQFEESATATPYQKRVNQYDVTQSGQRDLWYLSFDGVDDCLETAAIDFTATDKMSVFAGGHKASDAGASAFVELSANAGSNDGSFYILAPQSASDTYRYGSKGSTSIVTAAVAGYSAPITNMVTGISDIAGDDTTLRIDGTVATAKAADQGTGNYGNYPLYIGARAGTYLPFNGRLYGLTIVGKTTTAAEIAQTERYLASKSGVIL